MWMRYLVSHLVRQAAQDKLQQAVKDAASARLRPEGGSSEPAEPPPPCHTACLFALGIESGGLVDLMEDGVTTRCAAFTEHAGTVADRRVVVADTGVGRKSAVEAAEEVIRLHKPQWVISAGFAGGLQPGLRRGHIIMPDQLIDEEGHRLDVGFRMDPDTVAATKYLHVGRLLTVEKIVRTTAEKQQLAERFGAHACDMETMAIADVCRRLQVRLLSVRVISDGVDDELPPEIEKLLEQGSLAGKLGAATGAIFNRPSAVKDMWKLKEDALKASDRLARFLVGILGQLP